ncbi:MAG TPA: phytanoyl-CoA dioxygenase family protein [Acidimicrobiia bacterium]
MTPEERYFFDINGYLVVPGVLDTAEVGHLNAVLDRQALPEPGSSIQSQRFQADFLGWDPACLRLLDHERMLPLIEELCGSFVRLDHAYGILMSPGTYGLGLHGNATPWDPSSYYVWHGGRMHNGLIVVSYALVDVGPGDGGFCCIPGSHKSNLRLPEGVDRLPEHLRLVRQIPHRAGDVVAFTEALTHGTLPWNASYQRRHLLFKYSPGNSTWERAKPFPEALDQALTPRQRRLVEPPYVGSRSAVSQ